MKFIYCCFLSLFTLFIFSGCTKTENLHDRLVGSWNISSMTGFITDSTGTTQFDEINPGEFLFRDLLATAQGGTYSFLLKDRAKNVVLVSENEVITWTNDDKHIFIDNNEGKRIVMDVVLNSKKKQEWKTFYYLDKAQTRLIHIDRIVLEKK